jgi:LacI family transcriptional regulator
MHAAGVAPDRTLVRFGRAFTEAEGARTCRDLLDDRPVFTAILAGNDLMALGCYDVLEERGLRCPADVSVIGFNDMRFANRFNPPLTTIRLPHYEIGAAAADLLLERLQDATAKPRQLTLEPELVVRASTAPPVGA